MGRRKRNWQPGIYYHVTIRGNNRADIFLDDFDKSTLLGIIADAHERYAFTVLAYCIMTNHYHILMKSDDNMGKIMQLIHRRYSDHYSKRYEHIGRIYQCRYHAKPVVGPGVIRAVSRYIHRNPIETKRPLTADLADYPHSSFPMYARTGAEIPKYMDVTLLPSCMPPPFEGTAEGYCDYCLRDDEEDGIQFV